MTTCEHEYLQRPETSEEQSKNSETETVSIIANLPTLMITTPVDVRNENYIARKVYAHVMPGGERVW
jgi:hypothetical protein